MFVPAGAYSTLPPFLASFLSNGLVLGSVMAILLEILFSRSAQNKYRKLENFHYCTLPLELLR